ncbi:hypothetical protein GW17_00024768 [Ensete ventricosum]|nr:hypothetical protein GW17_00024768 [Ensete ventricosum]
MLGMLLGREADNDVSSRGGLKRRRMIARDRCGRLGVAEGKNKSPLPRVEGCGRSAEHQRREELTDSRAAEASPPSILLAGGRQLRTKSVLSKEEKQSSPKEGEEA